ncbi:helix-turn-helix domain-containing protein [Mesorhizobium sp. M0757]|uniref:helix-turn-helix domain-containing protein n=1 Tax=Mesorhizobium sp. M0757 TaxID=2956993 RepID=UPI00333BBE99
MNEEITAETSSGNVFADLGFDKPEEELLKAKLAREIRAIIQRRRLTQAKSAEMLSMTQPDVSAIVVGRTGKFSIDHLIRCFDQLDHKLDAEANRH